MAVIITKVKGVSTTRCTVLSGIVRRFNKLAALTTIRSLVFCPRYFLSVYLEDVLCCRLARLNRFNETVNETDGRIILTSAKNVDRCFLERSDTADEKLCCDTRAATHVLKLVQHRSHFACIVVGCFRCLVDCVATGLRKGYV